MPPLRPPPVWGGPDGICVVETTTPGTVVWLGAGAGDVVTWGGADVDVAGVGDWLAGGGSWPGDVGVGAGADMQVHVGEGRGVGV